MGNTVTPEAYNDIEMLYMRSGNLDKDTFCDDYKLHGGSKILAEIWKQFKIENAACDVYKKEHNAAAELLIKLADEYDNDQAYEMAVDMMGYNFVVKYKLENDMELTEKDKAYVLDHLR